MSRYQVGDYIDDPLTAEAALRAESLMNSSGGYNMNMPLGGYSGFNYQDMGLAGGKTYSSAFLPSIGGQGDLGESPEQTGMGDFSIMERYPGIKPDTAAFLDIILGEKNKSEDLKTFEAKLKLTEDSFARRAEMAQKLGLQSNLVGFALKGLPDMITKAAQARNQFLGDNIRIAGQPYSVGSTAGISGGYNI